MALATLILALAGCSPDGGEHGGGSLRIDGVGSLTDPAAVPRQLLLGATQAGLTAVDSSGRVMPGLASSWRIANDGRSIIFRLRPVKWPDGHPLVAADVVAAFRRLAAPASRVRGYLDTIGNAAAVGDGSAAAVALGVSAPVADVVEMQLTAPAAELLALLALPELAVTRSMPRATAHAESHPLALGAFVAGDAAAPLVLQRNPNYYAVGGVALGKVELTPVDDPGMAVARFAHSRTDIVVGQDLSGLSDARLLGPRVLHVEPAWGVYGYLANVRSGPLADVRVRRALAMAVDRDRLGIQLFGVAMLPVAGALPPGLASDPARALPDWAMLAPVDRLETAAALLTAAGYNAAHPLTLTVTLPSGREHAAVLASVAAGWAAIGVTISVREVSPAGLAAALKRGDFELALIEPTIAVDLPSLLLAQFHCGANPGSYCNPAADAALARAGSEPGALADAEAALLADPPMIPLFRPVRWALVQPGVSGWTDNIAGQHPLAALRIAGAKMLR